MKSKGKLTYFHKALPSFKKPDTGTKTAEQLLLVDQNQMPTTTVTSQSQI
jgi:hypothetical protein